MQYVNLKTTTYEYCIDLVKQTAPPPHKHTQKRSYGAVCDVYDDEIDGDDYKDG